MTAGLGAFCDNNAKYSEGHYSKRNQCVPPIEWLPGSLIGGLKREEEEVNGGHHTENPQYPFCTRPTQEIVNAASADK